MLTIERVQQQIDQTEAERLAALENVHKCEGALTVARHWLAELEREKAVAEAVEEAKRIGAETAADESAPAEQAQEGSTNVD